MLEIQRVSGPELGWPAMRSVDPMEVLAVVLTAVAANAFAYGALLQFHGVVTLSSTALLVGGGVATLLATGWLLVYAFVEQVVGR